MQGHDHTRTFSSSSVGSQFATQPGPSGMISPEQKHLPLNAPQRQYPIDRTRARSQSVSPKTILRPPPPARQASWTSDQNGPSDQLADSLTDTSHAVPSLETPLDGQRGTSPPRSSSATPRNQLRSSCQSTSAQPSPGGAGPVQSETPKSIDASLGSVRSPQVQKQPNLKRGASAISGTSSSPQPVRKRLRRNEIPIFAQSARKKPINLVRNQELPRPDIQVAVTNHRPVNGGGPNHAGTNGNVPNVPTPAPSLPPWEPSITNLVPYEDLTRRVCHWIVSTIGMAEAPSEGAVFEIEGKIGEIHDIEEGGRLNLPVDTEAIFNKDRFRRTKFESSMSMVCNPQPDVVPCKTMN